MLNYSLFATILIRLNQGMGSMHCKIKISVATNYLDKHIFWSTVWFHLHNYVPGANTSKTIEVRNVIHKSVYFIVLCGLNSEAMILSKKDRPCLGWSFLKFTWSYTFSILRPTQNDHNYWQNQGIVDHWHQAPTHWFNP